MILSTGRVCMLVSGRDAGKYCVVVDRADKNSLIVEGKGIKQGKVNSMHLEPLPKVLDIKKNSKTETILKELEKEGFQ